MKITPGNHITKNGTKVYVASHSKYSGCYEGSYLTVNTYGEPIVQELVWDYDGICIDNPDLSIDLNAKAALIPEPGATEILIELHKLADRLTQIEQFLKSKDGTHEPL